MEVTQVLSHAERRRQKKEDAKPKLGEEGSMKGTHNKQPLDTPSTKLPKRQNSVWVGNLSFKTSVESLKKFFDGVGEITRVHMPTKVANSGPGDKSKVKENLGLVSSSVMLPFAIYNVTWGIDLHTLTSPRLTRRWSRLLCLKTLWTADGY